MLSWRDEPTKDKKSLGRIFQGVNPGMKHFRDVQYGDESSLHRQGVVPGRRCKRYCNTKYAILYLLVFLAMLRLYIQPTDLVVEKW
jgi:hypothetical protein